MNVHLLLQVIFGVNLIQGKQKPDQHSYKKVSLNAGGNSFKSFCMFVFTYFEFVRQKTVLRLFVRGFICFKFNVNRFINKYVNYRYYILEVRSTCSVKLFITSIFDRMRQFFSILNDYHYTSTSGRIMCSFFLPTENFSLNASMRRKNTLT